MNELVKTENAIPDYIVGKLSGGFGDTDSSDIIMPRLKLVQKVSPEVDMYGVSPGDYFHSMVEGSVGSSVDFVPIRNVKAYNIWAPRGSDVPILARSSDAINWDAKYQNTTIKWTPKGKKKPVDIYLGVKCSDNGLIDFGSSDPENENSAPIATLSYNVLGYILEYGPAIFSMSRSSAKVARQLISKVEFRGVPPHAQLYKLSSRSEQKDGDTYLVPTFQAAGFASKEVFDRCGQLLRQFEGRIVRTADNDVDDEAAAASSGKGDVSEKF